MPAASRSTRLGKVAAVATRIKPLTDPQRTTRMPRARLSRRSSVGPGPLLGKQRVAAAGKPVPLLSLRRPRAVF